jgi:NADH-quinone oxidoreductase subunit C
MTAADIHTRLQTILPEVKLELQCGTAGDPWILVLPSDLIRVMQTLKNELEMNYLACLSGIDYGTSLGIVYQVRSLSAKIEIMIKTLVPREDPVVPTVSDLYDAAGWFEREAYDLIGIRFQNHPDLRRIMMPDDWIGHPLRKDYQQPLEYHGISCTRPDTHQLLGQFYTKNPSGESGAEPVIAPAKMPAAEADSANPDTKPVE